MSASTSSLLDVSVDNHANLTSMSALASAEKIGDKLPLYQSLGKPGNFSLHDYLARRVNLYGYTGSGAFAAPQVQQYAKDFFNLDSIAQKLKFTRFVRGTFKIDFVLTTNAYAIGQFVACNYMGVYSSINANDTSLNLYAPNFVTKNHAILDCGTCNSITMTIPMHFIDPYAIASITDDPNVDDMYFGLMSLTPILSTQDGTNAAYAIKVYVSLVDIEMAVPVVYDSRSIYTMNEVTETMSGPISFPASIVANVGRFLKDVPIIGPFAYATSIAADAVSSIAFMFGFSRPKDMSTINYPHEEDYASFGGSIRTKTLTLDPLQEVPIDASFLGDHDDNLSFKNIIGRRGLEQIFTWATSQTTGGLIGLINVTPCGGYIPNAANTTYAMSPLTYGAQLFNLWRGSIVYRIAIPGNSFLRGKMRVFWSPTILTTTTTEYQNISQNAPSVVIDLTSSTEAEITIPWGTARTYLPNYLCGTGIDSTHPCNGYLYFIVEEPLVVPAGAFTLTFLVWHWAGDDLEFHIPNIERIQYVRRQVWNSAYLTGTAASYSPAQQPVVMPIAAAVPTVLASDENWYLYTMKSNSNNPVLSTFETLLPQASTEDVVVNHMGEKFLSFRPLLKRFYPYTICPLEGNDMTSTTGEYGAWFLPFFPIEPLVFGTSPYKYPQALNTPVRYLSNLFYGVRGSTRYRLANNCTAGSSATGTTKLNVFRNFHIPFLQTYLVDTGLPMIPARAPSSSGEVSFNITMGESFIFDIPWQCVSQFFKTFIDSTNYLTVTYGVDICTLEAAPVYPIEVMSSIGEDFNPVIWNGVPLCAVFLPNFRDT